MDMKDRVDLSGTAVRISKCMPHAADSQQMKGIAQCAASFSLLRLALENFDAIDGAIEVKVKDPRYEAAEKKLISGYKRLEQVANPNMKHKFLPVECNLNDMPARAKSFVASCREKVETGANFLMSEARANIKSELMEVNKMKGGLGNGGNWKEKVEDCTFRVWGVSTLEGSTAMESLPCLVCAIGLCCISVVVDSNDFVTLFCCL